MGSCCSAPRLKNVNLNELVHDSEDCDKKRPREEESQDATKHARVTPRGSVISPEVLDVVFSFLTLKHQIKCTRVCIGWYMVMKRSNISINLNDFNFSKVFFVKTLILTRYFTAHISPLQISSIKMDIPSGSTLPLWFASCRNLIHLELDLSINPLSSSLIEMISLYENLQHLIIHASNFENPAPIFRFCKKLVTLQFKRQHIGTFNPDFLYHALDKESINVLTENNQGTLQNVVFQGITPNMLCENDMTTFVRKMKDLREFEFTYIEIDDLPREYPVRPYSRKFLTSLFGSEKLTKIILTKEHFKTAGGGKLLKLIGKGNLFRVKTSKEYDVEFVEVLDEMEKTRFEAEKVVIRRILGNEGNPKKKAPKTQTRTPRKTPAKKTTKTPRQTPKRK